MLRGPRESLDDQRAALVRHWAAHPWNFLTGTDVDGRPVVWTKDEGDRNNPIKPWPQHREFLRRYFDLLQDDRIRVLFVDKPRQMMISTATLQFAHWDCLFHRGRRWLLSKRTEDEAAEMLTDKVRYPYSNAPGWLREALPVLDRPYTRVIYPATSSYILAVAENVAGSEARGGTASGVIVDEAAFQSSTEEIVAAVAPMASKLVLVTTANLGNPGATFVHKHITRAREQGRIIAA